MRQTAVQHKASGKGATLFDQRLVDTGSVSQEGVPFGVAVDTLLNWADNGTKAYVRTLDVVAKADATSLERGSDKGVGMSHLDEEHHTSHGGDGEGRDG